MERLPDAHTYITLVGTKPDTPVREGGHSFQQEPSRAHPARRYILVLVGHSRRSRWNVLAHDDDGLNFLPIRRLTRDDVGDVVAVVAQRIEKLLRSPRKRPCSCCTTP